MIRTLPTCDRSELILPGILRLSQVIWNSDTGKWCQLPYPNHPKGCPKYGEHEQCPPQALAIDKLLDFSKPVYLVYSEFALWRHIEKMERRHPKWTERQKRNVLYWQGTSRSLLKEKIHLATVVTNMDTSVMCPEGSGVNVYATSMIHGLKLQKIKGLRICTHIALVGNRRV